MNSGRWSLSAKVIVGVVLLATLLMLTTSHLFRQYLLDDMTESLRLQTSQTLQTLSASVLDDLITEDIPKLETFVDEVIKSSSDYVFIKITNEQGKQLLYRQRHQFHQDSVFSYSHEINLEGEHFGNISIGTDLHGQYHRIDTLVTHAVQIVAVAMFLLTLLILLLLQGLVIVPLRRIHDRVLKLSEGELEDKLDIRSSSDMTVLADSINEHARVLQQQQEFQQQLQQERDRAEKASRAKTEFLSSMSHELRTPLNAILGFAQIMRLNDSLQKPEKDMMEEIIHAGEHLLQMVSRVLDLARIETGQLDLQISYVDVSELVSESCKLLSSLAETKKVTINNDIDDHLLVRADSLRLKQVIINLLTNAIKYNHEGGSVRLSAENYRDFLLLHISDNGRGIEPEFLPELFEPFNRLALHDATVEGAGIGLAISSNLMEMMNGKIEVWSEIDQGSVFTLRLPYQSSR